MEQKTKRRIKKTLLNRVLIRLDTIDTKVKKDAKGDMTTKGGIYIPKESSLADFDQRRQEGAEHGTVVQIGRSAYKKLFDEVCEIKVGDLVGFSRYAGVNPFPEGSPDGFKYRCMDEEAIMYILEEYEG